MMDQDSVLVHSWVKRCDIPVASSSLPVKVVSFGPKHLGLVLATGSGDGMVRIYEASDPRSPSSQWIMTEDFRAEQITSCTLASSHLGSTPSSTAIGTETSQTFPLEAKRLGVTSLHWNPSLFANRMLIVGVSFLNWQIWYYSSATRQWVGADVITLSTPATSSLFPPYPTCLPSYRPMQAASSNVLQSIRPGGQTPIPSTISTSGGGIGGGISGIPSAASSPRDSMNVSPMQAGSAHTSPLSTPTFRPSVQAGGLGSSPSMLGSSQRNLLSGGKSEEEANTEEAKQIVMSPPTTVVNLQGACYWSPSKGQSFMNLAISGGSMVIVISVDVEFIVNQLATGHYFASQAQMQAATDPSGLIRAPGYSTVPMQFPPPNKRTIHSRHMDHKVIVTPAPNLPSVVHVIYCGVVPNLEVLYTSNLGHLDTHLSASPSGHSSGVSPDLPMSDDPRDQASALRSPVAAFSTKPAQEDSLAYRSSGYRELLAPQSPPRNGTVAPTYKVWRRGTRNMHNTSIGWNVVGNRLYYTYEERVQVDNAQVLHTQDLSNLLSTLRSRRPSRDSHAPYLEASAPVTPTGVLSTPSSDGAATPTSPAPTAAAESSTVRIRTSYLYTDGDAWYDAFDVIQQRIEAGEDPGALLTPTYTNAPFPQLLDYYFHPDGDVRAFNNEKMNEYSEGAHPDDADYLSRGNERGGDYSLDDDSDDEWGGGCGVVLTPDFFNTM